MITFCSPHRFDDMQFNHENHSGNDDSSERSLRDVVKIGSQKLKRNEDENSSVDTSEGCFHSGRVIDCTSTQSPGDRHRGHER